MQNCRMSGDVLQPSPGNSNSSSQQRPTQAWEQLLQALKSPASAQQQQEVLAILKANPQLMAAFIKQRTAQQQQQQHQQQQLQQQHHQQQQQLQQQHQQQLQQQHQQLQQQQHQNQLQQQQQQNQLQQQQQQQNQLQQQQQEQQQQQQEQLQQQQILNEGNMITPLPPNVWYMQPQEEHLLDMQSQQQQPNQLAHPQPPMYPQSPCMSAPMNFGYQQGFQGDGSRFQFQQQPQQLMQPQIKQVASPTHLSVSPQQLQEQQQRNVVTPEITKSAPDFEGIAAVNGTFKNIKLTDYKGKYLVLFFYPSTLVRPAEIIAFSEKVEEFKRINCEVIGCSTGRPLSHLTWINTPREEGGLGMMNIPLLADESYKISKDYGVVCKENEDLTFRGLFIIDGNGILRQITISDLPVDKSVDETLHFVKAFQHIDQYV